MKQLLRSAFHWLTDTRVARCLVDTLFRSRARRRVVELDQQSVAQSQRRTLLTLLHQAHTTRFGKEHDFRRIRSISDFRRLVPLRTPLELWREYWNPSYPDLSNQTWPGPIPYLAISASPEDGGFPYTPMSPALWAEQQAAALTALAFVMHARPRARLCMGRLCYLGDDNLVRATGDLSALESQETIAMRELPFSIRPYAVAPWQGGSGLVNLRDDQILGDLAQRSVQMSVTCVAGTVERLGRFFDHARRATGKLALTDIWPQLSAILYARQNVHESVEPLLTDVGRRSVLRLEMYFRPEGAIAIEDPRHGCLRLLPDHGAFFEFVPLDQLGRPNPSRLGATEVKLGVPYALALSSPAGVWACLVGSVVCFESNNPPLFRLVETRLLASEKMPMLPGSRGGNSRMALPPPHLLGRPIDARSSLVRSRPN